MISGLMYEKGYVQAINFLDRSIGKVFLFILTLFIISEWFGRENQYALENMRFPRIIRWSFYLLIGAGIFVFGNFNETEFIYFAF